MAKEFQIEYLGRIPIDPSFTTMVETDGEGSYAKSFQKSNLFANFQTIADRVVDVTSKKL